ncbi:hypothetical protein [Bradyrhizobium erythrophlei]|uniref:hypothetical protein n=1 Tax=Bradyrhizobium erythrophlei TaxID=1437360 RepID=UPI0012AC45FF|nr:hypothetical protein [Bradyrhizobium erythrophlei]
MLRQGEIAVIASEDRDVERRFRRAISHEAQAPPDPKRINHYRARLSAQQTLDATAGIVGLTAAGSADKRQPVI